MGNTLTGLIPIIYLAANQVSRELVGMIPAVFRNAEATGAAVGQTITYPIVPAATVEDITPGQLPADTGDQTIAPGSMTISKSKAAIIRWTGEEKLSVNGQYNRIVVDQFAEAFRELTNQVESDLNALYAKFSRAYGTAGTTPFGTGDDLTDATETMRILTDNGAGLANLHLNLSSAAKAKLSGKQPGLFHVDKAGTDDLLRRGIIAQLEGFAVHSTGQAKTHTKGTGAGYLANSASLTVGTTSIPVDTGAGTVVAGDVVTFAGDANKYLVTTGIAAPGTLVIAKPGLRAAVADNTAMTVGNNYTANLALRQSAVHLITRHPAMPEDGDMASDVMNFTDPMTGISFQVAYYKLYRRTKIEIGLAWGADVVKPEHTAILLG